MTYVAPGVLVEERERPRPLVGAETSVAVFLGAARQGRSGRPKLISSFIEFTAHFGALRHDLELGYALLQFFANGGRQAWVVRVAQNATAVQWTRALKTLAQPALRSVGLVVLPGVTDPAIWALALAQAEPLRAFLVLDPPRAADTATAMSAVAASLPTWPDAAVYFPWVQIDDPTNPVPGSSRLSAPSGSVAGVIARTDLNRGVWKAPAGTEATLNAVLGLAASTAGEASESLNRDRINCLRDFSGRGLVVFGARTLAGADANGSEWKYVPVRRLARHVQVTVERGLDWVVFEPNAEPLWGEVRLLVENYLLTLFRQGAFAGQKASEAFFVRCDRTTMTAADQAAGRLKFTVGLAPLKPAEFVLVPIALATATA